MNRYQVWHGYAITNFSNREKAIKFAYENEGVVMDMWADPNVPAVIPTPASSPVEYWVGGECHYVRMTPAEIKETGVDIFKLDIRVSPR